MVDNSCSFAELLEFLRTRETFQLTSMNFIRVLREASGIRMTASRELLSMFDADFQPLASLDEIEALWRTTIYSRLA
jgi:hypothetical protein